MRHQIGSETMQTRAKIAGDGEGFVGKSQGARDVMRSTYFEGGTIREGKGHKGQGLGGEKGGEQGEVG